MRTAWFPTICRSATTPQRIASTSIVTKNGVVLVTPDMLRALLALRATP